MFGSSLMTKLQEHEVGMRDVKRDFFITPIISTSTHPRQLFRTIQSLTSLTGELKEVMVITLLEGSSLDPSNPPTYHPVLNILFFGKVEREQQNSCRVSWKTLRL